MTKCYFKPKIECSEDCMAHICYVSSELKKLKKEIESTEEYLKSAAPGSMTREASEKKLERDKKNYERIKNKGFILESMQPDENYTTQCFKLYRSYMLEREKTENDKKGIDIEEKDKRTKNLIGFSGLKKKSRRIFLLRSNDETYLF